ncbi:MAG: HAMP domain-containing histidine kinase [Clostridia bacterium]|nr:HAMP domain-containing histidine kinase [Clostridia bacterium]
MDTKLKNSKLRPIIKAIVLILTLVFAFLAGTNGLELARKTIYFNDAERIQDTPAFKENIENEIGNIFYRESIVYALSNYYGQNMSFEEFCEKSKLAQNIKEEHESTLNEALDYFYQITEIKKLEPQNDGTYYDSEVDLFFDQNDNAYYSLESFKENIYFENNPYSVPKETTTIFNPDVTSPSLPQTETTAVTVSASTVTNQVYKTHAEWEYEYQKLRNKIFSLVDDARSRETIKAELDAKLLQDLENAFTEEQWALEDFRDEYNNIDFLAINKETGCFVSSFTEEADVENFKKNYKNNAFYYYYFDGVKTIDSTEINIETPKSPLLKFIYSLFEIEQIYYTNVELINEYSGNEIYIKVNQPLVEKDEFYSLNEAFIKNSTLSEKELEAKTTIFSVLTIIGIIALAILSKPKYVEEKLKLTFNQRMFFIIQLCIFAFFVFCAGAGIAAVVCVDFLPEATIVSGGIEFLMNTNTMPELAGVFLAIIVFFITNFVNYIVVNKKAKSLKERFICYKSFKLLRKLAGRNKDLRKTVKQIEKKLIIVISIWLFVELLVFSLACSLFNTGEEGGGAFFTVAFIIITIIGLIFTLKFLGQIKTLALAVENMKNGNLNINLDSTKFIFPLKDFARNLNECRDSIEKAVGEALKGERLKTELITNVSHDLKTPLTSIINYVSLLKLCNIEGEDENKYLDILDEKSTKLKRLIEDLTEASKASSGNIKMIVDTVNLNELALQAVGENNDVLENVGLEIVLSQKDNELFVKADSQHTFRIFDNLFSNVKKYALSGTRVYVDVYKENGYGVFSVKNISKDKLNINPDEITERFVRGDNSRTTEGSGLGLSIARSFTELQNGIFEIQIDGDLFKVTIKLPITNKPVVKQEKIASPTNEFGTAREIEIK